MPKTTSERLETIAESLGFFETASLKTLRQEIAGTRSLRSVILLYADYHRWGEDVVNNLKTPEVRGTAQLGLSVSLARIWWEWGDNDRFIGRIKDILRRDEYSGQKEMPREATDELKQVLLKAEH